MVKICFLLCVLLLNAVILTRNSTPLVHKKVEASTAAYIAKKPDVGSASKTESNADVPSNPMGKRKSTDNSSKELEEVR